MTRAASAQARASTAAAIFRWAAIMPVNAAGV